MAKIGHEEVFGDHFFSKALQSSFLPTKVTTVVRLILRLNRSTGSKHSSDLHFWTYPSTEFPSLLQNLKNHRKNMKFVFQIARSPRPEGVRRCPIAYWKATFMYFMEIKKRWKKSFPKIFFRSTKNFECQKFRKFLEDFWKSNF